MPYGNRPDVILYSRCEVFIPETAEGLEPVKHMQQLGSQVFQQQFLLANDSVKRYFYEDQTEGDGFKEQFDKHIICCFNLPPSQFQIHMQFIFSPIVESLRWDCNTSHFMAGRCFPAEYVVALSKLADMGICVKMPLS